jgi:uncharacterized membrane protein
MAAVMVVLGVFLIVFVLVVPVTWGAVLLVRHVLRSDRAALLAGALLIPSICLLDLVFSLTDMEVDDPAPGNLLAGGLVLLMIATPMALATSCYAIRRARRPRYSE